MVGERLNRNLAGLWNINRNSCREWSEERFKKYLAEAVQLCEEAEDYNVRFGNHRWSKGRLSLIGNETPRWGAEVQIYVPSARGRGNYRVELFQYSAGGVSKKIVENTYYRNDGRRDMLKTIRDWQNQPDASFTLEEAFASMDLLLAAGKYWNLGRSEALPLSRDLAERAKSLLKWGVENYPVFSANNGVDIFPRGEAQFDLKTTKNSGWRVCMGNFNTHRVLEVILVSKNPYVDCFQVSYPPLERLGYGIPTRQLSGPKEIEEIETISKPSDLAPYVDWLVE